MFFLAWLLIAPQALWAQGVSIQGGRMSVDLREASLVTVARDIERQSGISFKGDESLLDETVSVAFKDLPLEQGVKRILAGLNYGLLYDSRGEISEVVIMSEGSVPGTAQPRIRRAPVRPGAPAQQRPVIRRPGTSAPFVPGERITPVPVRPRTPSPGSSRQRQSQSAPSASQALEDSSLPEPFRTIENAPAGGAESEGPLHPAFRVEESAEPPAAPEISPKEIAGPPTVAKDDKPREEQDSKQEAAPPPQQD